MYTKILGTGSYLPVQVRSNADLEKMVDTSDEWIVTRTGIRERRIAGPDETVASMGFQAAKKRWRWPLLMRVLIRKISG